MLEFILDCSAVSSNRENSYILLLICLCISPFIVSFFISFLFHFYFELFKKFIKKFFRFLAPVGLHKKTTIIVLWLCMCQNHILKDDYLVIRKVSLHYACDFCCCCRLMMASVFLLTTEKLNISNLTDCKVTVCIIHGKSAMMVLCVPFEFAILMPLFDIKNYFF